MLENLNLDTPTVILVVLQLVIAVILASTLRAARAQGKIQRKRLGIEALFNLRNEYSGISNFVYQLLDFHAFCKTRGGDAAEEYARAIQEEQKYGKNNLFLARQFVSGFYQKLAAYYAHGLVPRDLLFPYWPARDLELLDDVILPIEESTEGHSKRAVANMKRLYDESLRYKDSH